MNLEDISTQLLYTTVPITTKGPDGEGQTGTGFVFDISDPDEAHSLPLLVTNDHVVAGAQAGVIEFARGEDGRPVPGKRTRVELDASFFVEPVETDLDLRAIPLAPVLHHMENVGQTPFFRSIDVGLIPEDDDVEALSAIEDITFIGYPSGIRDEHNVSPLVRRGITSTPIWNDFQGDPVFLIDAGVFPGSSGSPVFIYNRGSYGTAKGLTVGTRLLFVGVIAETYLGHGQGGREIFLGLGRVINSLAVRKYLERVRDQIVAGVDLEGSG